MKGLSPRNLQYLTAMVRAWDEGEHPTPIAARRFFGDDPPTMLILRNRAEPAG